MSAAQPGSTRDWRTRALALVPRLVPMLLLALAGTALSGTAAAQTGASRDDGEDEPGTISQAVVQPLPSRDSLQLSSALSRLGRDPRDVNALVDAGNAALAMGDIEAALGFFKRANQVAPNSPRLKAGLAGAMVRSGDPVGAIGLFEEAERGGAAVATMAAERGLAYDLVGDNASAQYHYRIALAAGPDEDVTRRLAISQAISGDVRGVEETLLPQLRAQDKASWRTRAFSLAILGRAEEAVKITRTILPEALAMQVSPYLRYMPQLTRSQQAAAANLGSFPRASDIGRDDPKILAFNPAAARPRVATADAALVPKGEPLGSKGRKGDRPKLTSAERKAERRARDAARAAAASQSAQVAARVAPPVVRPTRAASEDPAIVAATPAPQPVRVAAATVAPNPTVRPPAASPSAPTPRPVSVPAPTPETAPALIRPSATVPPAPARAAAPTESPAAILARATPDSPVRPTAVTTAAPLPPPPTSATPVSATPAAAAPSPPVVATGPSLAAAIPVGTPPSPAPTAGTPTAAASAPAIVAAAVPAATAPPAQSVPAPGFDLARLPGLLDRAPAGEKVAPDTPLPGITEPPVSDSRQSLAEAFSDFAKPAAPAAKPAPGAVDITKINPAKPKPKVDPKAEAAAKAEAAKAKPAVPSHPSRIWVQLGIGRDVKALALDWRKLVKKAPEVFKDRKGYMSDMGQTNRMLAGPFESARAANTFIAQLKAADLGGPYIWTSPAGQVVDALPGK